MVQAARLTCMIVLAAAVVVAALLGWLLAAAPRVSVGTSPQKLRRLADVVPETWTRLNHKIIFFGHQSVGRNILRGLQDLQAGHPSVNLRIVETKDARQIEGPALAHGSVGRNHDPESKIAEFRSLLEGGLGEKVDIAFFKFCYVDIEKTSDPDALLAAYAQAMDGLKTRFPRVTFVHVTVPLGAPQRSLKEGVKRLLGRPSVLDHNLVRALQPAFARAVFRKGAAVRSGPVRDFGAGRATAFQSPEWTRSTRSGTFVYG